MLTQIYVKRLFDYDETLGHLLHKVDKGHRSNQCNQRNTGNPKDNTSGVKGVYWHKKRNKWKAEIRINGKGLYLGSYESFTDAVCVRLAGEQCLNWSGCDTNSPAYTYVKENYVKEK